MSLCSRRINLLKGTDTKTITRRSSVVVYAASSVSIYISFLFLLGISFDHREGRHQFFFLQCYVTGTIVWA
jgi:hypothetical protein